MSIPGYEKTLTGFLVINIPTVLPIIVTSLTQFRFSILLELNSSTPFVTEIIFRLFWVFCDSVFIRFYLKIILSSKLL
jgi:hypothetical protein